MWIWHGSITWAHKYLFENFLSIILSIYTKVELMDHMAIVFLIWGEPPYCFPYHLCYTPIHNAQSFQFLHTLVNTIFLIAAIMMGIPLISEHFIAFWFSCSSLLCPRLGISHFFQDFHWRRKIYEYKIEEIRRLENKSYEKGLKANR